MSPPTPLVTGPVPSGIHGVLAVLEEMAAVAGSGGASPVPEHFAWLPLSAAARLTDPDPGLAWTELSSADAERFGAIDAIRPHASTLRVGFGFVAGRREAGQSRTFEPLASLPVQVRGRNLHRVGDVQLTEQVTDRHQRLQLELEADWGPAALAGAGAVAQPQEMELAHGVVAWLSRVARAAGHDVGEAVPAVGQPATLAAPVGLRLVVGFGLFALGTRPEFSPAAALAQWQTTVGTAWTALHTLYLDHPGPRPTHHVRDLPSPYELTESQHAAVVAARTEPLTVIAGAPGTGKTHTVAAIVGDAVAQGLSVLVAAKADPSVEAVTELLQRRPGPDPVTFGSSDRGWALARQLAAGSPQPVPHEQVTRRWAVLEAARQDRDMAWTGLTDALQGIEMLGDGPAARAMRRRMPGLATADLLALERTIARVGLDQPPWWRPGLRRAWDGMAEALGTADLPTHADLVAVRDMAAAVRTLHSAADPLLDGLDWDGLAHAQDVVEHQAGEWMDALARDDRRLDRQARGTLGALATALRAGRAKRRAALSRLAGQHVTTALPVWVGTLADIDDLLPPQPAMFDVVVLDEASSIDQPRAAAALLRGARAVVVGDPQQLRHVSFVPDAAVTTAIATHLPDASPTLQAKLDVRGSSVFDVAASVAPVRTLDEHFRSAPHLFDFVGRTLYRGEVSLARRTPVTDREDRIRLVRLDGRRNRHKVVVAEVEWVMERLESLRASGVGSVGVISPFRAQADALADRARRTLGRRGIQELGLRVGTVHAFQGMERDVVLASVGVGGDDGATTWRFVNDPHLFAVLATRARERMEVVVAADPPPGSLLADYLRQVDVPPPPPMGIGVVDPWTAHVAQALAAAGVQVVAPYPAGRHQVDLVLHEGDRFLAVETRMHPDGPHAHARRHLELREAGWRIRAAHRVTWSGREAELVVALLSALRGR